MLPDFDALHAEPIFVHVYTSWQDGSRSVLYPLGFFAVVLNTTARITNSAGLPAACIPPGRARVWQQEGAQIADVNLSPTASPALQICGKLPFSPNRDRKAMEILQ